MQKGIFAIFDDKAAVFATPFFSPNEFVATRDLSSAVNDPMTSLFKHPADFSLYHLGDFDDASGAISSFDKPVHICTASSLKELSHARSE